MDGENRSWQGSEGGSTGVGAARALPRCPQAQVGPSGAAGGDSGDGRAPPVPFAHLAVPLEHLVDQFCFPGTGELLVKVLQGDSSKIPPFWSFLAELEDNFHFPGEAAELLDFGDEAPWKFYRLLRNLGHLPAPSSAGQ